MLSIIQADFLNIIFPNSCLLCKQSCRQNLCPYCLSLANNYPNIELLNGNKNIGSLFYYEFTIKTLIKEIKFHHQTSHLNTLMALIKNELKQSPLLDFLQNYQADALTFIPSHWSKNFFRPINLTAAFAYFVAQELNIQYKPMLLRKSNKTTSLIPNKKERKIAIKNSFVVKNIGQKYEKIILVDDIITTGTTLTECQKVLKNYYKSCLCLTIAKTP